MSEWQEYTLGDIVDIKHGYAFKGEFFSETPTTDILVTPGNFKIGGGFKSDKLKYYNGEIPDGFVLSHEDIIVTMTDLSKQADTLGYSAKVPIDSSKVFLHNQRIGLLIFKDKSFDKDFIYWLMRAEHYQKFVAGSATGATVKHSSPSRIRAFKFKAPTSNSLRKKIAKILSNYDDLIENNLKRIKLLEESARLTYEEWFLRFRIDGKKLDIDTATGLPFEWEVRKISDFVDTASGGTPSRRKPEEFYKDGTIPWVKTKELKNFMIIDADEHITEQGLKKSSAKMFPANTVLLAMYGNTIGEVTFSTFPTSTNQACCAFLVKDKAYLSYFIHQYLLKNKQKILGYRMGAAQENISQQIIKSIEIEIPSESLLQLFGKRLSEKYNLIKSLHTQNQLLKEARDILLPRLMTGMIDTDNMDIAV